MAKKLTKGKRKYLIELVNNAAYIAGIEKRAQQQAASVIRDIRRNRLNGVFW